MITSSPTTSNPVRFGIFRRKPRAPKLKYYFGPGTVLGCSTFDSKPLPMLTDHHDAATLSEGIKIDEWPVFARTPKSVPLQTAGMCSCSALRIDGPGDEHYMMHLNPISDVPAVEKHLREDIPWDLTDEKTSIDIIPGIESPSDTIKVILQALHRINKDLPKKVRFHHFPESSAEWGASRNHNGGLDNPRAVVSYDGDIFCSNRTNEEPRFFTGGMPISANHKPIARFA